MRKHRDAGQAFPIYLTVVGGLLFLALAYFAVGQAATTRSQAQTAADAAALGAALETRDELTDLWLANIAHPDEWLAIFQGDAPVTNACWRAQDLATRNKATAKCSWLAPLRYEVEAETSDPVGKTIIPGTEGQTATETATALIEFRCSFTLPTENADDSPLPPLTCGGKEWPLKPDGRRDLPKAEDLFDVHLAN
ncbi:pilus assembly protein TadG-related protein [Streptomyces sp. NPDC048182]|uniref:pilus assembly protein TadG-related protein n=1 Tax=Streptomyces sp. NPDC048182 TaxID=3365507 RepID=UPI00371397C5